MTDLSSVSGDLRAHYPMDTGSGDKLFDQTLHSLHGTLHGPAWEQVGMAMIA